MTDTTPPPELVRHWSRFQGDTNPEALWFRIADKAAQWGADQRGEVNEAQLKEARDQELEACCEVVSHWYGDWVNGINLPIMLRAARRPKPPSLAEQGLQILAENGTTLSGRIELDPEDIETFRAALVRLKQLEDSDD